MSTTETGRGRGLQDEREGLSKKTKIRVGSKNQLNSKRRTQQPGFEMTLRGSVQIQRHIDRDQMGEDLGRS